MLFPVQITRPDGGTFNGEVEAESLQQAKQELEDLYDEKDGYTVWFPPQASTFILPPPPDSGVRIKVV